jgi:hypothetical protein
MCDKMTGSLRTLKSAVLALYVFAVPLHGEEAFCGFDSLHSLLKARTPPESLETMCGGQPDSTSETVRQLLGLLNTDIPRYFRWPTRRMVIEDWVARRIIADSQHLSLLDSAMMSVTDDSRYDLLPSLARIAGTTRRARFASGLIQAIARTSTDTSYFCYETVPELGWLACDLSYRKLISYLDGEPNCCTYAAMLGLERLRDRRAVPHLLRYLDSEWPITCAFDSPVPYKREQDSLWFVASQAIAEIIGVELQQDHKPFAEWVRDSLEPAARRMLGLPLPPGPVLEP